MSDKKKWPAAEAEPVINELMDGLVNCCVRVAVAGSYRRQKKEVGDIEILYVPEFCNRQIDMFANAPVNITEEKIERWLADGTLKKRPNKEGHFNWGPKNKLAIHAATGIPVDLFATTLDNWWVSLVVRTGSKETNLRLTNGAQKLGRSLNAYGCGVTFLSSGEIVAADSEEKVFELCGVPYLPPHER